MAQTRFVLIMIVLATALAACSTSPTGRNQLMIVSPESAISESKSAYIATVGELESQGKLLTSGSTVERIRSITGRLVTEAITKFPDTRKWSWSVAIIKDPDTLNAWCMAGGRMAIYTGIIDQLSLSDDEIAQIMGHEISHALANHTAEQMSRAMVINGGLAAASIVTENNGMVLSGTAMAAQLALQLPNSRTAEKEADEIGSELAARAGYDPYAAVSLWRKMESAGGSSGPEFLSTHPSSSNRAKRLGDLAPKMKALNPAGNKSTIFPVNIITD